jgi:transcriptional regulator with XRE-family HTH domain
MLMMEIANNSFYAQSDAALVNMLGEFVRHQRLTQNITQEDLAKLAGINRSTLVKFEGGKGGNLNILIQLLRALNQLHILESFQARHELSPLQLAKLEAEERKRASKHGKSSNKKPDW